MNIDIQIPRYQILDKIGEGGMASVYLALQESVNRKVAIKILDPSLLSDETFAERFILEASIAAKLDHPNVIHVLDVAKHDDIYYMVMEYLPGKTLEDMIVEGMTIEDSIATFCAVAAGLQEAHIQGVIHRDIKPSNVLFRKGQPVLTDFGVARETHANTDLTQFNAIIGTPKYMSPEQARGGKVDCRADVYSMGVLLFYMLSGTHPFDGNSAIEIALNHEKQAIPKLPDFLSDFQPVIDKLLDKVARTRPANIEECAQELRKIYRHWSTKTIQTRPEHSQASDATIISNKTIVGRPLFLENAPSLETSESFRQTQLMVEEEPEAAHATPQKRNKPANQSARTKPRTPTESIPATDNTTDREKSHNKGLKVAALSLLILCGVGYLALSQLDAPPQPLIEDQSNSAQVLSPSAASQTKTPIVQEKQQSTLEPQLTTQSPIASAPQTTVSAPIESSIKTAPAEPQTSEPSAPKASTVPKGFTRVPGGNVLIGGEQFNEKPKHQVRVRTFYISTNEVTFREYDEFAMARGLALPNDMGWGRGDRPVINVSWNDAVAYTKWLSNKLGRKARLPSEAEWEYAARGNKPTRFYWGDKLLPDHAVCTGCVSKVTGRGSQTVASFPPNPFGLYDMLGNVREWVSDCYQNSYRGAPTNGSPRLNPGCPSKVYRGGGWSDGANKVRSASRNGISASTKNAMTGFRVVIDI